VCGFATPLRHCEAKQSNPEIAMTMLFFRIASGFRPPGDEVRLQHTCKQKLFVSFALNKASPPQVGREKL
jgi:hypothetical protein